MKLYWKAAAAHLIMCSLTGLVLASFIFRTLPVSKSAPTDLIIHGIMVMLALVATYLTNSIRKALLHEEEAKDQKDSFKTQPGYKA
jgi:hypothetical protein